MDDSAVTIYSGDMSSNAMQELDATIGMLMRRIENLESHNVSLIEGIRELQDLWIVNQELRDELQSGLQGIRAHVDTRFDDFTTELRILNAQAAYRIRQNHSNVNLAAFDHSRVSLPQPLAQAYPVISQLPTSGLMISRMAQELFVLPEKRVLVLRPTQLAKAAPLNFFSAKAKINLTAVYGQIRGEEQNPPCYHCRLDRADCRGPFATCVTAPLGMGAGACMNCYYGGHGNECTLNNGSSAKNKARARDASGNGNDGNGNGQSASVPSGTSATPGAAATGSVIAAA